MLNASPIISLAHAGYSHLLLSMPEQVFIPRQVYEEIMAGSADDPALHFVQAHLDEIIESDIQAEIQAWDLGKGESAVLSTAYQNPGWTAIIDDLAARKCARSFSIPCKGTLAVVILARQQGLIPSAAIVLQALRASGFYLDENTIREALQESLGEDW